MSKDLVAFLNARLDEDAELAMAATPGPWRHDEAKHWRKPGTSWFEEAVFAGPTGEAATCVAGTGETDDQQSMRDAAHIARHDPARVLAEVKAKRRIVDEYATTCRLRDEATARIKAAGDSPDPGDLDTWDRAQREAAILEGPVTLLALPYADHRDYRVEWRP